MKPRGKFLTILLVLMFLYGLLALFGAFANYNMATSGKIPLDFSVYPPFGAALLLLIANIGLWLWKKWAIILSIVLALYLLTLTTYGQVTNILSINGQINSVIIKLIINLAILGFIIFLFYKAIKAKSSNFTN